MVFEVFNRLDLFEFNPLTTMEYLFIRYSTCLSLSSTLAAIVIFIVYLAINVVESNMFPYTQTTITDDIWKDTSQVLLPSISGLGLFDIDGNLIEDQSIVEYQFDVCEYTSTDSGIWMSSASCTKIETEKCTPLTDDLLCPKQDVYVKGGPLSDTFTYLRVSIGECVSGPQCQDSNSIRNKTLGGTVQFQSRTTVPDSLIGNGLLENTDVFHSLRWYVLGNHSTSVNVLYTKTDVTVKPIFYFGGKSGSYVVYDSAQSYVSELNTDTLVYFTGFIRLASLNHAISFYPFSIFQILSNLGSLVAFMILLGKGISFYTRRKFEVGGEYKHTELPSRFSTELLHNEIRNHYHKKHSNSKFCSICETQCENRDDLNDHFQANHPKLVGRVPNLMCELCQIRRLNLKISEQYQDISSNEDLLRRIHSASTIIQSMKTKLLVEDQELNKM